MYPVMAKKCNLLHFKLNEFSQQVFTRLLWVYETSPESHKKKNKQWSSIPYMPGLFQLLSVTDFIAPLLLAEVIQNSLTSGVNCAYLATCCDHTTVVTSPQHMKCSPLGTSKSQEQSKKIHITGTFSGQQSPEIHHCCCCRHCRLHCRLSS